MDRSERIVTLVLLQVHTFEIPGFAAKFSLKTSLNSGPGTILSAKDEAKDRREAAPKESSLAPL